MDLIIELIKAIVEAFENRKKPQPETLPETLPAETFPNRSQELYETQQRIQQKQEALNQQRALAAKALADAAAEQQQQAKATAAATAAARTARAAAGPQRLARLLRQPATMREVLILNELLRPPKALRRGQR